VRANSLQAFGTGLQTPSRLVIPADPALNGAVKNRYLKVGVVPEPEAGRDMHPVRNVSTDLGTWADLCVRTVFKRLGRGCKPVPLRMPDMPQHARAGSLGRFDQACVVIVRGLEAE